MFQEKYRFLFKILIIQQDNLQLPQIPLIKNIKTQCIEIYVMLNNPLLKFKN